MLLECQVLLIDLNHFFFRRYKGAQKTKESFIAQLERKAVVKLEFPKFIFFTVI